MHTRKIIIELVPGRLTIAAIERGRIASAVRLPFVADHDPSEWARSLRKLSAELHTHVEQSRLQGCPATVLYASPTAVVDLHSAAVSSSGAAAESALLSCTDALPYSSLMAVTQAQVIGRDRTGDRRQTHVLVAAERNDVAEAIVECVEDAGLKYQSATPMDALILRRLAVEALHNMGEPKGSLYIGEHSSFFIVSGGGHIDFERRLSFDIRSMMNTLRRPIHRGGEGGQPIELSEFDAAEIVRQFGIPARDAVVHDPLKLTGTQIIPLLQPLLQRLVVELRQSLRFGVGEKQREQVSIVLSGPGVRVPNLATTLADEIGQEVTIDQSWNEFDFTEPVCPRGEVSRSLSRARIISQLNLQPNELAQTRRSKRIKQWLWTGAAAALAIIAVDYLQYDAQLKKAGEQAERLSMSAGDIEALRATSTKLKSTIDELTKLESHIDRESGSSASFHAIMNELTHWTPHSVRLTSINFQLLEERMVGQVNGYVFQSAGASDEASLERYIDDLRGSPLFEQVHLGNVQMGSVAGQDGRRFEAQLVAVDAPWQLIQQQLATTTASATTTAGAAGDAP